MPKVQYRLNMRTEDVFVFANTDFIKNGLQHLMVLIYSTTSFTEATEGYDSRYADGGSDMTTISVSNQYKTPLSKRIIFSAGARYSSILLNAVLMV